MNFFFLFNRTTLYLELLEILLWKGCMWKKNKKKLFSPEIGGPY